MLTQNNEDQRTKAIEVKILEFLFDFVRNLSPRYNLFVKIAEIVGNKYYEQRNGNDLMKFVERCLFKSPLTDAIIIEDVEDRAIKIPLTDDLWSRDGSLHY